MSMHIVWGLAVLAAGIDTGAEPMLDSRTG